VSFIDDTAHQVRVPLGTVTEQKERGLAAVEGKQVQQLGGVLRVRAVVEGETYPLTVNPSQRFSPLDVRHLV
jgi:hypothetical protein